MSMEQQTTQSDLDFMTNEHGSYVIHDQSYLFNDLTRMGIQSPLILHKPDGDEDLRIKLRTAYLRTKRDQTKEKYLDLLNVLRHDAEYCRQSGISLSPEFFTKEKKVKLLQLLWTTAEKKYQVYISSTRNEWEDGEQQRKNDNSLKANAALQELSQNELYAESILKEEIELAVSQTEKIVRERAAENNMLIKAVLNSRP